VQTLIVETPTPGVTLIRINRPEALNALNSAVLSELGATLEAIEADDTIRCLVLTGSERAFGAGADIKEMSDKTYAEMFMSEYFAAAARQVELVEKRAPAFRGR
jgi:enoyl-CoA hydratase/carnithine racemase